MNPSVRPNRSPFILTATTLMTVAAAATALPQLHWMTRSSMPRAQAGGAAALFGHTMIAAGGTAWEDGVKLWLTDVQLYDTIADKWSSGPALPEPLAYGPFAQSDSSLEIFGGAGSASAASRAIWRIDSSLGKWAKAGETPADHLLGRAARIGKRVYLFGGCADVADLTRCSDDVWMREDGAPAWRTVAKLPGGPVALSAITVHNGRAYLFGGCAMPEPGKLFNRAEAWSFDPASHRFQKLRDLPAANRGLTAAVLDKRILLFGGYVDAGFTPAVWSYDTAHDTYTAEAPMPTAMTSAEFCPRGKLLFAAGGEDKMKHRSAQTFAVSLGAGAP